MDIHLKICIENKKKMKLAVIIMKNRARNKQINSKMSLRSEISAFILYFPPPTHFVQFISTINATYFLIRSPH